MAASVVLLENFAEIKILHQMVLSELQCLAE